MIIRSRELEAEVLIKLLGVREVSCWHKSLNLYCRQIAHDESPKLGRIIVGILPASHGSNWPKLDTQVVVQNVRLHYRGKSGTHPK
jgi:hypothetical protein